MFGSAALFFGFWQTLHASLGSKKFLAVTFEAWLCVTSPLALTCLPCSQGAACSKHTALAALKKEPSPARGARQPS